MQRTRVAAALGALVIAVPVIVTVAPADSATLTVGHTGTRLSTTFEVDEGFPSLSPDGLKVVYMADTFAGAPDWVSNRKTPELHIRALSDTTTATGADTLLNTGSGAIVDIAAVPPHQANERNERIVEAGAANEVLVAYGGFRDFAFDGFFDGDGKPNPSCTRISNSLVSLSHCHTAVDPATVIVRNAVDGRFYVLGTDYTIESGGGYDEDVATPFDNTVTILNATIPAGTPLEVTARRPWIGVTVQVGTDPVALFPRRAVDSQLAEGNRLDARPFGADEATIVVTKSNGTVLARNTDYTLTQVAGSGTAVRHDDRWEIAVTGGSPLENETLWVFARGWEVAFVEDTFPAWSPGGDWIAFRRTVRRIQDGSWSHAFPSDIYIVKPDDETSLTRMTPAGANDYHQITGVPVWSPDGSRLAFAWRGLNEDSNFGRNSSMASLAIMDPTAPPSTYAQAIGASRLVVDAMAKSSLWHLDGIGWSPDGRYIKFASSQEFNGSGVTPRATQMRVLDTQTMTFTVVSDPTIGASSFSTWSPDSRWVAFVQDGSIRLARPDGTRVLTVDRADDFVVDTVEDEEVTVPGNGDAVALAMTGAVLDTVEVTRVDEEPFVEGVHYELVLDDKGTETATDDVVSIKLLAQGGAGPAGGLEPQSEAVEDDDASEDDAAAEDDASAEDDGAAEDDETSEDDELAPFNGGDPDVAVTVSYRYATSFGGFGKAAFRPVVSDGTYELAFVGTDSVNGASYRLLIATVSAADGSLLLLRQVLTDGEVPGAQPGWPSWSADGDFLLWRGAGSFSFNGDDEGADAWAATACLYDDATLVSAAAHGGPWRTSVGATFVTWGYWSPPFDWNSYEKSNLTVVTLTNGRDIPSDCAPVEPVVLPPGPTDPDPTDPPGVQPPGLPAPTVPTGQAEIRVNGTVIPLAPSAPGRNQVRYSADGFTVTFTGAPGTNAKNGLVANPNGTVECEVCALLATGAVLETWIYSTPRLVAAHRIEDLPCQRFTIPLGAPLDGRGPVDRGAHTLQLRMPTAAGMQYLDVGITVGSLVPARVPAGEGPVGQGLPVVLVLLLAGMATVGLERRRTAAAPAHLPTAG